MKHEALSAIRMLLPRYACYIPAHAYSTWPPHPPLFQPYRRLSFSLPLLEALELVEVAVWEHVDLTIYLVGVAACGPDFIPGRCGSMWACIHTWGVYSYLMHLTPHRQLMLSPLCCPPPPLPGSFSSAPHGHPE